MGNLTKDIGHSGNTFSLGSSKLSRFLFGKLGRELVVEGKLYIILSK